MWDTLRSLLIVLVGVLCIRTFVAEATVIPTGSMESTILIGDHVFLNKLLYGPQVPYTSICACRPSGKFTGWILWRFAILSTLP